MEVNGKKNLFTLLMHQDLKEIFSIMSDMLCKVHPNVHISAVIFQS